MSSIINAFILKSFKPRIIQDEDIAQHIEMALSFKHTHLGLFPLRDSKMSFGLTAG